MVSKNEKIHFIQNFPATFRRRIQPKTIYTFSENSLQRFSFKDKLFFYLTIMRSNQIDLLDIKIFKRIRKLTFRKNKINLTIPGSTNPKKYNFDSSHKKNTILFLGRFNDQKQILPFVESIEHIDFVLKKNGISDAKYALLGGGPSIDQVDTYVKDLKEKGIQIYHEYSKHYVEIMQESRIFLSLQKHNNYPSNSLMEAMSCGNIPVITDCGNSRLMADDSIAKYIPEKFNKEDLSEAILSLLSASPEQFDTWSKLMRDKILQEFNIKFAAEYYVKLYEKA